MIAVVPCLPHTMPKPLFVIPDMCFAVVSILKFTRALSLLLLWQPPSHNYLAYAENNIFHYVF